MFPLGQQRFCNIQIMQEIEVQMWASLRNADDPKQNEGGLRPAYPNYYVHMYPDIWARAESNGSIRRRVSSGVRRSLQNLIKLLIAGKKEKKIRYLIIYDTHTFNLWSMDH